MPEIGISHIPNFFLGDIQLGGHVDSMHIHSHRELKREQLQEQPDLTDFNEKITVQATIRDNKTIITEGPMSEGLEKIPQHILAVKRLDVVSIYDWSMKGVGGGATVSCSGKVRIKAFIMNDVKQKGWRPLNYGRRWRIKTWELLLEVQGVMTYRNLDRDPVRPDMLNRHT